MNSTVNPEVPKPDDVLVSRADERLAHAYEQIARADEQLARVTEQLSRMEHDAARHPSAVLASSALGRQPSRGRSALRGLIGLLLAACVFSAAFVLQSSNSDAAKLMIARWMPQLILTSPLRLEKAEAAAQPSPLGGVQLAAAASTSAQPTASAQTTPQDVAPTAAPLAAELAQLRETIARDQANLEQRLDELKAGQEQMTRLIAKASEQIQQPRMPAPPPPPSAAQARKLVPTLPSPQARAQPRPPAQPQQQER
jgi:uncharacterized coiled-coil protein SlyX